MDLDRSSRGVAKVVAQELESGEEIEAILPFGRTGLSPWLIGLVGWLFFVFVRYYGIVVTDRRVLFVRSKRVEQAYPRAAVKVVAFKRGRLWGLLHLDRPTAGPLKLSFSFRFNGQAETVARALGWEPART